MVQTLAFGLLVNAMIALESAVVLTSLQARKAVGDNCHYSLLFHLGPNIGAVPPPK